MRLFIAFITAIIGLIIIIIMIAISPINFEEEARICTELMFLGGGGDDCWFDLAIESKNIEACANIADTTIRISCLALINQNPNLCLDPNVRGSDSQNLCFAIAEEESTYCQNIQNGRVRAICISTLAKIFHDEALCATLDKENNQYCIHEVAVSTKDTELCLTMETSQSIDFCLHRVAGRSKDPSVCKLMKNISETCIIHVAIVRRDLALCDTLSAGQQNCRSRVLG